MSAGLSAGYRQVKLRCLDTIRLRAGEAAGAGAGLQDGLVDPSHGRFTRPAASRGRGKDTYHGKRQATALWAVPPTPTRRRAAWLQFPAKPLGSARNQEPRTKNGTADFSLPLNYQRSTIHSSSAASARTRGKRNLSRPVRCAVGCRSREKIIFGFSCRLGFALHHEPGRADYLSRAWRASRRRCRGSDGALPSKGRVRWLSAPSSVERRARRARPTGSAPRGAPPPAHIQAEEENRHRRVANQDFTILSQTADKLRRILSQI